MDNNPNNANNVPKDIAGNQAQDNELAGVVVDENGQKFQFDPNNTISTSDNSSVGDFAKMEVENTTTNPMNDNALASVSNNTKKGMSPAKMDFVMTYTKEYDDLVAAALHAVELILTSIDKTVTEHKDDITIPEEAVNFLDQKPENNRVSKFDEAQQIVKTVMGKATEAKASGEQAAKEASQIYDNIQRFKKDTRDDIASIRNRDEFGQPINAKEESEMPTIYQS